MRTILVLLLLWSWPVVDRLAVDDPVMWWRAGGPRVRPHDARVATLLRTGLDRSPTLRTLVDRVEDSDVIVYLEIQPKLQGRLAGCMTWVAGAGRYRYVRASINPELTTDQRIAAIAHELQHVVEISEHPEVDGESALIALYRRIGESRPFNSTQWDTTRAREVGAVVGRELSVAPVAKTARASGVVSPLEWHTWYFQKRAFTY